MAAAAVWALAPALSARPYVPPAQDFEQPVAGIASVTARATEGHGSEGPVTHRSGVIEAPARFDAVGIGGELRPVEYRARDEGGTWTPWQETANGDPVWFGGADQLQLRTRGWRPAGTLHYVNVSGDATPGEGLLTSARSAVNSVVVAATGVLGPGDAAAAPAKPAIVSRAAWGANQDDGGCRPRRDASYGRVKAAAVHHTVSANSYTQKEAPAMVLAICRFHKYGNGWDDIGYNALVDRFGNLYAGRAGGIGKPVIGAHAQGFNDQTTALASLGTHSKNGISREALRSSAKYLAWKLAHHGKPAVGRVRLVSGGGDLNRYPEGEKVYVPRVSGHRKLGLTECPGDGLNRQLDELRRRAQRRIDAAGGVKPPADDGGTTGGTGAK